MCTQNNCWSKCKIFVNSGMFIYLDIELWLLSLFIACKIWRIHMHIL
ncbi:hypothetical protein HanXRQr2_Chr13g0583951 [Helianthus annuus]|uniref:Uncharacterized protein n=1 Tax=Helianthus annuus TaxID=4232 RepID=A0A9K3EGB9_HELAN|nr:hypothetical protein HanXRQr2_Chr13g0583951 [Helianthus annuus]